MTSKDLQIPTLGARLREMIAAQPGALREIARLDVSYQAGRLAGAQRIFVVGTGTSFHAAQLGAYLLRSGGIEAQAVSSLEAARWRDDVSDGVIIISHTGETAYAQYVREAVRRSGRPLVTITGEGSGWEEAVKTPVKERAETYTVSYTGALAVMGLLGAALVGSDTGAASILGSADEVERLLGSAPRAQIAAVAAPERALALVGPGPWGVTAREGALKLREGAQILAEGFDPEALLHGAAAPYGPTDALIALGDDDDQDGLTGSIVEAARDSGVSILKLPGATSGERTGQPMTASQRFLAQIPVTVTLQLLAESFARQRDTDPDTAITGAWTRVGLWSAGAPAAEDQPR